MKTHRTRHAAAKSLGWSRAKLYEVLRQMRGPLLPSEPEAQSASIAQPEPEPQPVPAVAPKAPPKPFSNARFPSLAASLKVPEPRAPKSRPSVRVASGGFREIPYEPGHVYRFIETSALPDGSTHLPFFSNLVALGEALNAPVAVGGSLARPEAYDSALLGHLELGRARFTPSLQIMSGSGTSITSSKPLEGWGDEHGGQHFIVPHARRALFSIPRLPGQPARFGMTTGSVSLPSYASSAIGERAAARHTMGALLVEVDVDGHFFFHRLLPDAAGDFHFLDCRVEGGRVSYGHRVAGIVCGDEHHANIDRAIASSFFGIDPLTLDPVWEPSIMRWLRPRTIIRHDVVDGHARRRQEIRNVPAMVERFFSGRGSVEAEVRAAARWILASTPAWCRSRQVESNHDHGISKWVERGAGFKDHQNARYAHRMMDARLAAAEAGDGAFNLIRHALSEEPGYAETVDFLPYGSSLKVAGHEVGMHGDEGKNGSPGSVAQFVGTGVPTITAHGHYPVEIGRNIGVGTFGKLYTGFNGRGLGTQAHSFAMIYPNGSAAQALMAPDGRVRAEGHDGIARRRSMLEALPLAA